MNGFASLRKRSLTPAPARAASKGVLQRKCACGNHTPGGGECTACAAKRERMQRSATSRDGIDSGRADAESIVASGGQPLEQRTRDGMEQRFGHDFSGVRVHADARADASARAVHAHAYTLGDHIVFGQNRYAPGSAGGDRLLAHELTHVVQQRGASGGMQYRKAISHPSDAAEVEADTVAERVMRGDPVRVTQAPSAVVQELDTGESIGLGAGIVAGVGLLGLGIAALAGAFNRRRWSITQTNHDGPNYSSDVEITFNPDRETMNCSEIAFVQSLIFADETSGSSVETLQNYVDRRTPGGWTLDRVPGRQHGWYGYNDTGTPAGNVTPGSSPSPLRAATLRDSPSDVRPNSRFQFETCAICRAGTDVNQAYGCYTWGFSVDASNHLTSLANQETNAPSANFNASVTQWNAQATGPAAQRNSPTQQSLGPFR